VCPDQPLGFSPGPSKLPNNGAATDENCLSNDYIGIPGASKYTYPVDFFTGSVFSTLNLKVL